MNRTNRPIKDFQSNRFGYLLILSLAVYILLYFYHGFIAFKGDTIETVPYALWMADSSLFAQDFHLSHLREIFPNERWLISWILHFFPNHIYLFSLLFHALFSIILIAGMIRFADIILKNIELSVLSVFICLFSLYNINTGSNELYYNMFVASLASKSVGIWAIIYFYNKRFLRSSILLATCTFLHPLVGIQLFVVLTGILFLTKVLGWDPLPMKTIVRFSGIFIFTGGIWVGFILGAQGPNVGSTQAFFDIVEFRIAHHFFPSYFPKSHVIIISALSIFSTVYFFKKHTILFLFYLITGVGIISYLIGIYLEIELFLSSQWMKTTIWLKFFSIIAIFSWLQSLIEIKYQRLLFIIGFIVSLLLALVRFNPKYDSLPNQTLYSWIKQHTIKDDLFLVPPHLSDFKYHSKRSSYFDFKAMLHHKPEIFEWAKRFEQVYGMKIGDRSTGDDIFGKIKGRFAHGNIIHESSPIDYFIIPNNTDYQIIIDTFDLQERKPLYIDSDFIIYGQEEQQKQAKNQ